MIPPLSVVNTRRTLALLRLILIYTIVCLCILQMGLLWQRTGAPSLNSSERLPPPDDPAMQIPLLGTTVALEQFDSAERTAALERLRKHGFGWVRQRLDWGTLEPAPGQFDWQQSDAIVRDIAQSGLVPVVVLDGSPTWARAAIDAGSRDAALAPPADPADFAAFAEQFARRYADIVQFYQIWDEPNIAPHWGNRHIEPVAYARLLAAGGSAIRAADPDAVILTAALAPTLDRGHTAIDEIYFLQRLYAAQPPHAAPLFDAVAIQPYGFQYAPNATPNHALHFRRAEEIRHALVAAGLSDVPIWAVRYGWNRRSGSPWSTVTPATQTAFATGALDVAQAEWPWLPTMGWAMDQPAQPREEPVWGFALNLRLLLRFSRWSQGETAEAKAAPNAVAPHAITAQAAWPMPPVALLSGLIATVAWRGWAAASILPWRKWTRRLRTAPAWVRMGCWAILLGVYYTATWLPLIGLCVLGAIYLNHARKMDGLCLAVLVLPFTFQHKEIVFLDHTWLVTPAQAALLALLPALVVHGRLPQRPNGWGLLAGAWLVMGLLSAWHVWHWPAYRDGMIQLMVVPLLLFVAVRVLASEERALRCVSRALLGGGVLVAIIGLLRWAGGHGTDADGVLRLVGPHFSPNHTALYLGRTLFLGAGFVLADRGRGRLLWVWGCVIVLGALLLTASRGAIFIGLPVGLVVLYSLLAAPANGLRWPDRGSVRRLFLWVLLLSGGIAAGALLFLFRERLLNSDTLLYRWQIWRATLQLWGDHLWTGVGPGGFFWRYPAYVLTLPQADPNLRHPHNLWLEFVALWGIFGLLWLLAFLWLLLRDLRRVRGHAQQAWPYLGALVGLAVGLGHAQFDTFTALADLAGWNWVALGIWSSVQPNFTPHSGPHRLEPTHIDES